MATFAHHQRIGRAARPPVADLDSGERARHADRPLDGQLAQRAAGCWTNDRHHRGRHHHLLGADHGVRSHGIEAPPTTEIDVEITAADNNVRALRRYLVGVTRDGRHLLRDAMDVIVAYIPGVTRSGLQPTGPSLSTGASISAWRADQTLDYFDEGHGLAGASTVQRALDGSPAPCPRRSM